MGDTKNILPTGPPGSGKTTVIRRLLELLPPGAAAGFYTEEIREGGKRTGFAAQVVGGPRIVLARASGEGLRRVGRYAVEVEAFEEMVLRPLKAALKDPSRRFLVIDEIGKMELLAPSFAELVLACLEDPRPLVAPVMLAPHPFANRVKARPDVKVVTVTMGNHERLPAEVAERLSEFLPQDGARC
ncbi:MAG: nucleoside-triphosphatase [Moorellales bacterium]